MLSLGDALATVAEARAFRRNPLEVLARRAPPGRCGRLHIATRPFDVVSSHEVATAILRDPRFIKAPGPLAPLEAMPAALAYARVIGGGLPLLDGEEALARRRLLGPVYARAHQQQLLLDDGVHGRARLLALIDEHRGAAGHDDVVDLYRVAARFAVEKLFALFLGQSCEAISNGIVVGLDDAAAAIDAAAQSVLPWTLDGPWPVARGVRRARETLLSLAESALDTLPATAPFSAIADSDRAIVVDEILTSMVAGTDTTALSICWTLTFLARHPSWCSRLRQEAATGSTTSLTAVIRESQRLCPPLWQTPRVPTQDVVIDGYRFEQGAFVMVCLALANRDPVFGDDVDAFDPARAARGGPSPLSFGHGPRSCIGGRLALSTIEAAIAAIVDSGDVAFVDPDAEARPLLFGLKREGGFPARLTPRVTTASSSASASARAG